MWARLLKVCQRNVEKLCQWLQHRASCIDNRPRLEGVLVNFDVDSQPGMLVSVHIGQQVSSIAWQDCTGSQGIVYIKTECTSDVTNQVGGLGCSEWSGNV